MGFSTAGPASYSYVFSALVYTGFLLYLVRVGAAVLRRGPLDIVFFCAVLVTAVWSWLLVASLRISVDEGLVAWADLLRYGLWFLFLLLLIRPPDRFGTAWAANGLVITAILLLVVSLLSTGLIDLGPRANQQYKLVSLYAGLSLPLYGSILVEQLFRNVAVDSRWNAKPLCIGLLCIFALDLYLRSRAVLFGGPENNSEVVRSAIHAVAVPFLFVAFGRKSSWSAALQLSRTAAFHSVSLLLVGVYLLFISLVGYYVRFFGGEWGPALQLAVSFVAVAAIAAVALSGAMQAKLRVVIGKSFFRYRYDYRKEWLRFTRTLSAEPLPQRIGERIVRGLADMLESPGGSLWARPAGQTRFLQTSVWNMARCNQSEEYDSPFCVFLRERGWIISTDEYRSAPERYGALPLPTWLTSSANAWLVIPLAVGEHLVAFVVLVKARTAIDLNWEVTDLLKTASCQAASYLAQMQATEELLEVRKFDAFNRMSAFVVHDLKNIVTQLTLMMKNAKRLAGNPEFQQDMLMTVENSLGKMHQLMLQLRDGESRHDGSSGVDLASILRSTEAMAVGRERTLKVELIDRVVARGHEQRIERVIGHLVQNALDATSERDQVWIRVERVSGQAKVQVGDTGHGMSAEFVRDRLFKPFQTTKETGMGIGAYESYQYVRELGGSIEVDSELNRGTVVTLLLPLFETREVNDRRVASA